MPRRLVASAALSVACLPPLLLAGCDKPPPSDPRTEAPLVRTITLTEAAPDARAFTGTVAARVQSEPGFRVGGKILERLVDAGQQVKRGQILMRIDPIDLRLAATAQLEAVAAARARARQTAQDEARYRDLRGTGAISASAYDQMAAAAEAATAQLKAAEAQAEVAHNASRYADLVADADGTVMETLAEPGQVVAAGQPVLRLARAGSREAVIALPETLRPKLGSTGLATLFGQQGPAVPTRLRQLSDSAERATRTYEARYVLDGPLAAAPLGATVTIQLPDATAASATPVANDRAWSVPMGALHDAGKGPGLWLIQGQPAKVAWRPVAVQRLGDDVAFVTGQFKSGQRIVAMGAHLLREDQPVRLAAELAELAEPAASPATGSGAKP
ncbi:MAG: efflux RND transporter periplasmic adaptor subunit [Burkholderiaceae bacterium]|nr:efflux RND transporter periplasmic adaptor subunit [Burkholderiaceae bacterium]